MSETTLSTTKLVVPLSIAVAVGWVVASFVFGAGSKVGTADRDIAYLTSRVDGLVSLNKELTDTLNKERELVARLDQRVTALESAEAGRDIRISMEDTPKPKRSH